ncbi:MAG: S-layer homology domain-containing protein [Clostridiales bacterium]|nr:S-layer homology domain-containing protein [Clostridiales bacterium]
MDRQGKQRFWIALLAGVGLLLSSIPASLAVMGAGNSTAGIVISNTLHGNLTQVTPPPGPGPAPTPPAPTPETPGTWTVKPGEETAVTFNDGALEITLPKGGVAEDATLTVQEVPRASWPSLGSRILLGNTLYDITLKDKDGKPIRELLSPLTLSFRLPADRPQEPLHVFYYDEFLKAWIALPSKVEGDRIYAKVSHFTVFAPLAAPGFPQLKDIEGYWAEEDIYKLISLGAITGYDDGTFRPQSLTTRAEMTAMLVRALKLPLRGTVPFRDPIPAWAQPYIGAAYDKGLVRGFEDGTFRPDEPITREASVVLLIRGLPFLPQGKDLAGFMPSPEPLPFRDQGKIASWALEDVRLAYQLGLARGFEDGTFRPQEPTSRGQMAALIARWLSLGQK